ncbi:hypothetical protein [Geotalea uraniireducens]|uniref:hypothetical protein n=1 Tax=Geotalea uraniireducens TaxID=351604 RepID=UPI00248FBE06|nr:hypothetical protein [Geotalea uraniireducens]
MSTLRRRFFLTLLIAFLWTTVFARSGGAENAAANTAVTEGELAALLVRTLGLESGLPADPKPADYRTVLSGNRTYHFEAEDVYDTRGDNTSVRSYPLYGPFTGSGWLSGLAGSTKIRFTIFLPRAGEYSLHVVARGDGQQWQAGDRIFRVDSGSSLREAVAGKVDLPAGKQTITLILPPEGAVDSFTLSAAAVTPLEPLGGWDFAATLTWGRFAEVLASMRSLDSQLPVDGPGAVKNVSVADAAVLPATVETTAIDYLGAHTAAHWVRAGVGGARLEIPLQIPTAGVYGVRIRLLGEQVAVSLDSTKAIWPGKPYFSWFDLGLKRFAQGKHLLVLALPPMGGADVVELTRYKASPSEYLKLTGLPDAAGMPVPRSECVKYLKLAIDLMHGQK